MILIIFVIVVILNNVNCYKTISISSKSSALSTLRISTSLLSSYNNEVLSKLTKQGLELKTASSENEMNQAAAFLASQMYDADMPNGQRRELQRLEYVDLMNRYGGRTGIRKYPSALLLAIENEEIIGMVGIDCQIYDEQDKKFIPMKYVTKSYDEPGKKVVQVLANLAIRRDKRKKGLGRLLLNACADTSKSFGYDELYLQVDSTNKAAQSLYRKEGYKQIFADPNATCVVSGQWGLQTKECTNLGFSKKIANSNSSPISLFDGFFNFLKKT